MRIGLDLDGVVVDIIAPILPHLTDIVGRPVTTEDLTCFDLRECLNLNEAQMKRLRRLILWGELYSQAPPIDGAIEGIQRLANHEIWFVTARPENTRQHTVEWLERYELPSSPLVLTEHGKKIVGDMGFDLFVDDDVGTALGLAELGVSVLLFDHPWNQHPALPPNCHRVRGWPEVVSYVDGRETDR